MRYLSSRRLGLHSVLVEVEREEEDGVFVEDELELRSEDVGDLLRTMGTDPCAHLGGVV